MSRIEALNQQGKYCSNNSKSSKCHECDPHRGLWVCYPEEFNKAILETRGIKEESLRWKSEDTALGQRPMCTGHVGPNCTVRKVVQPVHFFKHPVIQT